MTRTMVTMMGPYARGTVGIHAARPVQMLVTTKEREHVGWTDGCFGVVLVAMWGCYPNGCFPQHAGVTGDWVAGAGAPLIAPTSAEQAVSNSLPGGKEAQRSAVPGLSD